MRVADGRDKGEVLTFRTTIYVDTWILDIGASHHMTYPCDFFDSFKEQNGMVKLGDEWMCCIKGSDTRNIEYVKVFKCTLLLS